MYACKQWKIGQAVHASVRWNVIFLFSRQHNRQRRRTLTGCWWWGSFYWPSAWASPVSSWPSSFSSSQNRKIFRCYGSSSHRFSIVYFFIMSVICFWIIFYAQPLHCIRYQRKLKAATAMVYGEYEISETYQDFFLLSFFLLVKYNQDGCKPNGLNWRLYVFLGQENDMQKTQVPGTNLHAYEK